MTVSRRRLDRSGTHLGGRHVDDHLGAAGKLLTFGGDGLTKSPAAAKEYAHR
jgi:hypothetical protein